MSKRLRIAILTHSTNPRGGVVHALELGDALCRADHYVTVHAPDPNRNGFFRKTVCRTSAVPASRSGPDVTTMVEARIADYVRYFESEQNRPFDVWHAQDGISGNALATLKERGLISGFARTVHHVDAFEDERLSALQLRAIATADCLFVVSRVWQHWLAHALGRDACPVGNGVDMTRFSPMPDSTDVEVRERLRLERGDPVFLAVGGIEERKNSIRLLQAFCAVRARRPACRLVLAGGASLLDHAAYQARFAAALAQSALPEDAVVRAGPWPQQLMPALYRAATSLVFPSIKEGFGLVVLEAMASGIPVITSQIAPFVDYLGPHDVAWCDPYDAASIAAAMEVSLDPSRRERCIEGGLRIATDHDWARTARAHLASYDQLSEPAYA